MIRLLTAGIRAALVAAAMAVAVPMIAFAQTTEPAIESTPAAAKPNAAQTSPTEDANNTDKGTAAQAKAPAKPATPTSTDVEMQRRFNELQRRLLDDREKLVDWWLVAITIVLGILALVSVLLGYVGFRRFQKIEAEARENVTTSKQHAEAARSLVEEIKAKRDEAESLVEELDAETVGKNPDEAGRAAESVQGNPAASLIDQAIAAAVLFQRQGEIDKAVETWRASPAWPRKTITISPRELGFPSVIWPEMRTRKIAYRPMTEQSA